MKFFHEIREADSRHFFYVMIEPQELANIVSGDQRFSFIERIMNKLAARVARHLFQSISSMDELVDMKLLHKEIAKEIIKEYKIKVEGRKDTEK